MYNTPNERMHCNTPNEARSPQMHTQSTDDPCTSHSTHTCAYTHLNVHYATCMHRHEHSHTRTHTHAYRSTPVRTCTTHIYTMYTYVHVDTHTLMSQVDIYTCSQNAYTHVHAHTYTHLHTPPLTCYTCWRRNTPAASIQTHC